MKRKSFKFALLGAIALMGSVGFSACSDDLDDSGTGSGAVKDEVSIPVNFVFNVSTSQATTRMSAANTQDDGKFLGINNANMYAFKTGSDGNWVSNPGENGDNMLRKFPEFSSLIGSGTSRPEPRILQLPMPSNTNALLFYGKAPKSGSNRAAHNAQGYLVSEYPDDVASISHAYVTRLEESVKNKFYQVGDMLAAIMTGIADMGFKKSSIEPLDREFYFWGNTADVTDNTPVNWEHSDHILIYGCSHNTLQANNPDNIAPKYYAEDITTETPENENAPDGLVNTKVENGKTYKLYHANVTWHRYGKWVTQNINTEPTSEEPELSALGERLGDAYNALMIVKDRKEMRAASASATLYTLRDLYSVVNSVSSAAPTTRKEWVAVEFAKRLLARIKIYAGYDDTGNFNWADLATIKASINRYAQAANNSISISEVNTRSDLTDFPDGNTYGIPRGGAIFNISFEYDGVDMTDNNDYGGLFTFVKDIANYDLGGTISTSGDPESYVTVSDYVYPAELMYFGNSPVRVSEKETKSNDFPAAADWLDGTKWDATYNDGSSNKNIWPAQAGHVTSNTKSVAMMHNINYGVALLETKVKINGDNGYIYDNNKNFNPTEDDRAIAVNNNLFELTGVIIGNQPSQVGWNYTAPALGDVMNSSEKWECLVYDAVNPSASVTAEATTATRTLLLDNYMNGWNTAGNPASGTQIDQQPVYVALEFVNKGDNFWGQHNMVRKDGTFYLIGKLDINKTGDSGREFNTAKRTDYALPPYTSGNELNKIERVFMQDYKTTATFVIGKESLKKAYVTVPNLSASQVSLGLTVDISWSAGIDFGEVILGDQ